MNPISSSIDQKKQKKKKKKKETLTHYFVEGVISI